MKTEITKYKTTDHYEVLYDGERYDYSESFDTNTGDFIVHCLLTRTGKSVKNYNEILEYIQNHIG